jgi:SlyX protein
MDDIATLIARIDALEARVAHQDRAIEDLNETITAKWKEIDSLTRQVVRLGDQLQEVRDRAPEGPEPPPPHY